jgi:NAD+ kinase
MKLDLKTCALTGQLSEPRVAECAASLVRDLHRRGIRVLVASEDAGDALPPHAESAPRSELPHRAQLLFSIGGDGTLLQAARLVAAYDVPVMGINRGRLGFLTDVLPQEMTACVDALIAGRCEADRRVLLNAQLLRRNAAPSAMDALNDVVLLRRESGRMLDFETRVNGHYVNSHSGDGFVVATATGSTAYAMSCGGPIVEPTLNVLLMVPICPHTMSDRPIMVPGDAKIEINLFERGEGRADVTCDGALLGDMGPGDQLLISSGTLKVTLLHPPGYDYFRLLRSKLHWGRGRDDQPER